jgi:hypothetical protein
MSWSLLPRSRPAVETYQKAYSSDPCREQVKPTVRAQTAGILDVERRLPGVLRLIPFRNGSILAGHGKKRYSVGCRNEKNDKDHCLRRRCCLYLRVPCHRLPCRSASISSQDARGLQRANCGFRLGDQGVLKPPFEGPTTLEEIEPNRTSDGIREPAGGLPKPSR